MHKARDRTPDPDPTRRWLTPIWVAIGLALVLRVGLSLFGAIVAWGGVPSPCHFEEALNGWRTLPELLRDGPAFIVGGIWERWDACWYMKIAAFGYEPGEHSVAFFPLFPAQVRLVGSVSFLPYPIAGMIVSATAYVVAAVGLIRLVSDTHGPRIGRWTLVLLSIFPSAFFLLAPFTEATFLATAVWSLLLARQRRWDWVIVVALLAGLARPQGLLLAIPIAYEAIRAASRRPRPRWLEVAMSGVAAVAPIGGFAAFALLTAMVTGESPLGAQALWGGDAIHAPWDVVGASVAWVVERGDLVQALNLAALVGGGVLLAIGARRMPLTFSLYAWPPLLLLATRLQPTPLTSTTRYVLVLFPVFVVAALLTERPWVRASWIATSIVLLGLLTAWFVRGDFVA